jgi:glycosyltransferase involved in cell wall biosynthesis
MDVSLEIIQLLKQIVELHVLIELTPGSKKENIIDIETLPEDKVFVNLPELMKAEDYRYMEPYFAGVASVNFAVHAKKSSKTSLLTSAKVFQYVKQLKPDIFHLEALQIRSVGLLPSMLLVKKVIIAVHDPVPHSGETSLKVSLTRFSFYRFPKAKGYVLYSEFARKQFDEHNQHLKSPRHVLHLNPYTYYKNYQRDQERQRKHILFFGRLSPYKGIDVLLQAFPAVLKQFPEEQLVIAGKSFEGYVPERKIVEKFKDNIDVRNRYITNEELVDLISQAKFIVCPYKDATQSGVLMTAFALRTPVIASAIGAFPEYIDDNKTGMLVPVNDAEKLAEKMLAALENNFYEVMEAAIVENEKNHSWSLANKTALSQAYNI